MKKDSPQRPAICAGCPGGQTDVMASPVDRQRPDVYMTICVQARRAMTTNRCRRSRQDVQ